MVLSIRSSTCAYSPVFRRAPRGAAGGIRAAVLRVMAGFAALVALLFFAIPVQADEIEPEPVPDVVSEEEVFSEPAWIPSIEHGFEGFSYDVEATVMNLSHPDPDDPQHRSGTQIGSVNQLVFRIGGELMGPMFEDLPGRPRLFVQGGAGFSAFSSENIFEIGKPDVPFEPQADIDTYLRNGPGANELPFGFKGQGSRLNPEFRDPSWYAGLGIAFSVPISSDLLLYIKPSVQYSMEEIDFNGKLKTVVETTPPGTPVDPDPCGTVTPPRQPWRPPCNRTFDPRQSNANFSTTDHSIGAGLEVAMAFRSTRPIRFSLFGQVRALWLVSGTTNSFTDPGPNGAASYRIVRDGLVFKGGIGLRWSWVGFD